MAVVKFWPAVLLATCLLVLGAVAMATTDPELKQCKHQCRHQEQFTERQKDKCEQQCEDYYRQKKDREAETETGEFSQGKGKQLKDCQKQCERLQGSSQQKQSCRLQCWERFGEKETEPWSREEGSRGSSGNPSEQEWEQFEEDNPYVFQQKHFRSQVETEHGRVQILPRFNELSKLLTGLGNYRLGVLRANPQTFVIPGHWDADQVIFVASGRGSLHVILHDKRQSVNIEKGEMVWIPAGTTVYLTNRDENEQLYIASFLQPVNTPGQFEVYQGAAGQNPESFYTAFSWEVLEAALKTSKDKLQRLFGQQQQGAIVKASKEQIEAMSRSGEGKKHWPFESEEETGKYWPFGGETRGSRGPRTYSVNIFDRRPSQSNQYGKLYEVDRDDFRQLRDLDLGVSFANISRGSMTALFYNSRATKIAMVVDGKGRLEMACPHLASQQQQSQRHSSRGQGQTGEQTTSYENVRSRLSPGTVFIIPAGHPATVIASRNNNLQVVCFEVNAENNVRYTLSGKRNIIRPMHKEAKELAFNFPAREVDRIFQNQEEEFFLPGPELQELQEDVIHRWGDA